ncbi:MAG: N-acetylmuramoyl-L-alanine amidase, partial [Sinomicrobium sp.]|nr:N-acetylmuramoyl-L-alanine amidase [Sinomicrobium sp.]
DLLEGMKRSHLERGFSDIAQNITTFPDGTLAVCRPLSAIPAGIKGANSGGICIEHVGNFDAGKDEMTEVHATAILYLNALLCAKLELDPDPDSIVYHHWWDLRTGKRENGGGATKSCPGTGFFGGNKVTDATDHFIPKIKALLQEMDLASA